MGVLKYLKIYILYVNSIPQKKLIENAKLYLSLLILQISFTLENQWTACEIYNENPIYSIIWTNIF